MIAIMAGPFINYFHSIVVDFSDMHPDEIRYKISLIDDHTIQSLFAFLTHHTLQNNKHN